ncbi:MAG: hypothetical protein IJD51_02920 [Clostridia bacterium]|nr:hypothetical protein [Clostridia bacterium]
MNFLSERNIRQHREYVRELEHRYSIFVKSYPVLEGKDAVGIRLSRIARGEREEALRLYCELAAHRLFFSSFCDRCVRCAAIAERYGSEASFLHELLRYSLEREGFLLIYVDRRGEVRYSAGREYCDIFLRQSPSLAVDLCEHAYLPDYGFDKYTYLKRALSFLDLSKITKDIAK